MKRLTIFDLDGTLLNTIADLANSTNVALTKLGFPTHETEKYNFMVGNGINKLFERALPESERNDTNILKMREIFLNHYSINNTLYSKPYEGITSLLEKLQEKGVKIAVASNKYQSGTRKLVQHYFPQIKFCAVYGQRENINTKPDPTIVYDILKDANIKDKKEVLYIGDSGVDMQTALNAKIESCGVTWGFRPKSELMQFNPSFIVNKASEILEIIE